MRIGAACKFALALVGSLWAVWFLGLLLPLNLQNWGIWPRHLRGVVGVPIAPFLHKDAGHLAANSGPLLVLATLGLAAAPRATAKALAVIVFAGGGMVWLLGDPLALLGASGPVAVHIGASGVVFGLAGFLTLFGALRRDWRTLAASLVTLLLYASMLAGLFYAPAGTSLSSHIFGFGAGLWAAWLFRNDARA